MKKLAPAKVKKYKPKKCASCGETFTPARNLQKVCGPLCAIAHNRALKAKKAEAEQKDKLKMRKKALLTRGDYIKKAQSAFNAFIRERDEGKHYSKEDLENIAAKYRRKTRELKKQRAA